ncbi:MAG: hypothetical protein ACTSXD_06870 [Candidatus Heimdallarchaeaceae archaeon]
MQHKCYYAKNPQDGKITRYTPAFRKFELYNITYPKEIEDELMIDLFGKSKYRSVLSKFKFLKKIPIVCKLYRALYYGWQLPFIRSVQADNYSYKPRVKVYGFPLFPFRKADKNFKHTGYDGKQLEML